MSKEGKARKKAFADVGKKGGTDMSTSKNLQGPYKVEKHGSVYYYKDPEHTIRHRLDGAAVEYADGTKKWYVEGKLHNLDGPAVELADGTKAWYVEGKLHNLDGPAIEYTNGTKRWFIEGKEYLSEEEYHKAIALLHRLDGSAIEYANGDEEWWVKGKLHHLNEPVKELANGDEEWWVKGKLHHLNEPVKELANGTKPLNLLKSRSESNEMSNVKAKKEEKPMTFAQKMKAEMADAAYTAAGMQAANLVKAALIRACESKDPDRAAFVKEAVNSEAGTAAILCLLGHGLAYAPMIGEDPRAQKLGEEMRKAGYAQGFNMVIGLMMAYIMPDLKGLVDSLPALPALESPKVRVPVAASVNDDEEEEMVAAPTVAGKKKAALKRRKLWVEG